MQPSLVFPVAAVAALTLWPGRPCDAGGAEPRSTFRVPEGEVLAVAFAPDGKTLACGCGKGLRDPFGELQRWDVGTGTLRDTLKGHKGGVACVAFAADGKTLVSGSYDQTARTWDAEGKPGTTLRGSAPVFAVALTGDGKLAAVGHWDLDLCEVAGGKVRAKFKWAPGVHRDFITAVAFSPDDRLLASASYDGTVKVWDVRHVKEPGETDDALARLRGKKRWDGRMPQLQLTLKGPVAIVWSVAFAPDGEALASAYEDGTVVLWNPTTGDERSRLRHTTAVKSVAFAPDGKTLATGCEDGTVRLWDAATGKERFSVQAHPTGLSCVAFAPDGKTLASAGGSEVKLWDVDAATPEKK
jgi:WD40 repeat protein